MSFLAKQEKNVEKPETMGVHRVQSLGRRLRKNLKAKMNQIQSTCTASRILYTQFIKGLFCSGSVIVSNENKDGQRSLSDVFLEFLFVFKELMQFQGMILQICIIFLILHHLNNYTHGLSNMKAFAGLRLNWCKKNKILKRFLCFLKVFKAYMYLVFYLRHMYLHNFCSGKPTVTFFFLFFSLFCVLSLHIF